MRKEGPAARRGLPELSLRWGKGSALAGCVHDNGKLVCLQGSAADQTAVHIGLAEQFFGVLGIHAAAVLNGQGLGGILAVQLTNDLTDGRADFLGLVSGSGLAGADGP